MNIGIIGAGNVGTGLGKRLAAAGHAVVVSFGRTREAVEAAAKAIGSGARAGTPEDAVAFGEVVIVAIPWGVTIDTLRPLADLLCGKVVWDATNPLKADMSGLAIGTTTSAGEAIAAALPGAKVVKAVPPFAEVLHSGSMQVGAGRPSVFVCSDHPEARAAVLGLVADVGADGVDTGPLALARYTEPLGMLLVQLAYVQGFGVRIGAALLKESAHD